MARCSVKAQEHTVLCVNYSRVINC